MSRTNFSGGDIIKNQAFKYILSIGYELETNNLIKLTEITEDFKSKTPAHILLNTDSSQRDITEMLDEEYDEDEMEENSKNKEYVYRREEQLFLKVDKENVSFNITNDMAKSPFIKKLESVCTNIQPGEEMTAALEEKREEYKDKLYKYKVDGGPTYKINFLHGPENSDCATFSDVEWVVTHYKPKLHSNVVLETFTDTIKYLLKHLHKLKLKHGQFIMNDGTGGETVILKHAGLYELPKSGLRYLKPTAGDLESVPITIQMTFSAHVSNMFLIMKKLTEDNLKSSNKGSDRYQQLLNLEMCVKHLVEKYNEKETNYKLALSEKSTKRDRLLMRNIYNYIALILYKLQVYYNKYYSLSSETKEGAYFKNYLALNARHNNYQLYVELKRCLRVFFDTKLFGKSKSEQNAVLATIIKRLFIQHDVLVKYLLKDKNEKLIRKNAFNIKNVLGPADTKHYGDPHYSLVAYFDFFENPIDKDKPDWFEYKQIDSNSTKMNIKDDIILIEFREFPRVLANYISSVLDASDRDEMSKRVLGLLSIGTLEKFIRKYNSARNLKTAPLTLTSLTLTGNDDDDDVPNEVLIPKKTEMTQGRKYKSKTKTKTRKFNKKALQKQQSEKIEHKIKNY